VPVSLGGTALSPQLDIALAAESSTLSAAKNGAIAGNRNKIGDAAREFEATLLTKWLEEARHGCGGVPGGDEDEDGDEAQQGEILDLGLKSLATAITKSGGIGIARVLCRELQLRANAETPPANPDGFSIGKVASLTKINPEKD
jgi:peptidoglycan hydrolase FlgJ